MYFLWILFYPSSRTTSYWVTFCSYVSVDLTPSLSLFITWSYWTLPSLCLWVSSASPPSLYTLVLYRGVLTSNFITSIPISRHLISFHPVSQCNFMSGFFFFHIFLSNVRKCHFSHQTTFSFIFLSRLTFLPHLICYYLHISYDFRS